MNANEVNEVINNICEKIGIGIESAKEFVPMLAKYEIMHNAMWAMLWLTVSIVLAICFKVYMNKAERWDAEEHSGWEHDKGDDYRFIGKAFVFASALIFLIFVFFVFESFDWMLNPQVKAVEYILNMI